MAKERRRLVVVEFSTKAKTIRGYLPAGYQVAASMGHVRDLPESASDIPADVKGKDWARLGWTWSTTSSRSTWCRPGSARW
jgi:DNA topoisomerase-1